MTNRESELNRELLQNALDLHGRDQRISQEDCDLSLTDVREIAAELGVPSAYVDQALNQPLVRYPTKDAPQTFIAERYVTHNAQEVLGAALTYMDRIERYSPEHPIAFGYHLKPKTQPDAAMIFEDDAGRLDGFTGLDVSVHQVEEGLSILRIKGQLVARGSNVATGTGVGVLMGGFLSFTPIFVLSDNLLTAIIGATVGAAVTGIAGYLGSRHLWHSRIHTLGERLGLALNAAAATVDNPLPPQKDVGTQLAEGAGRVIGAFMRGLGEAADSKQFPWSPKDSK